MENVNVSEWISYLHPGMQGDAVNNYIHGKYLPGVVRQGKFGIEQCSQSSLPDSLFW